MGNDIGNGTKVFALDKSTLVPLGLLIAVVISAIGGTWQLSSVLNSFQREQEHRDQEFVLKFQRIEIQLSNVQETVSRSAGDLWKRADMREWSSIMKASNPTLNVPEVPK